MSFFDELDGVVGELAPAFEIARIETNVVVALDCRLQGKIFRRQLDP